MRCSTTAGGSWAGPFQRPNAAWAACPRVVWMLAVILGLLPGQGLADEQPEKIQPPEDITLRTGDGVSILATYYPGTLGKHAAAVILLHSSKSTRGDFAPLALRLQQSGHAVVALDLRGYGESARPIERAGELKSVDYLAMSDRGGDVEAVKSFLLAKNNAGELNIEKLGVVGVEMGAVVALNWALLDWSWPPLTTGKQGQDVKGLVLVSPEWSFKGLRINDAVADPVLRADVAMMIIAGKQGSKALQDARRIYNSLERFHPLPPPEASDKQTLWLRTPATSLQGMPLLNEKSLKLQQDISKFVELRLAKLAIPWSERRNPLE
jgi:pimeloyl-ACP methyl ester carboxylesterase